MEKSNISIEEEDKPEKLALLLKSAQSNAFVAEKAVRGVPSSVEVSSLTVAEFSIIGYNENNYPGVYVFRGGKWKQIF